MINSVLVIAVHPDDETLGCGGTLLKHKKNGDNIFWLIATSMHEKYGFNKADITKRRKEIEKVNKLFDFNRMHYLDYPTTQLDQIPISQFIKDIDDVIKQIKPNIIYLPFKNDIHSDHQITFQASFTCIKSFRYPFIKRVLMMETLSETEFSPAISNCAFIPNVFVDISELIEKKIEIMKIYHSEMKEHPFPRSIKNIRALAALRGATAGVRYAESFMLLKEIV